MTRSVDESLARLGVDYVDFIQIHDMEFGSIEQIITETIPALREVQAAGKARFVGITCLPLKLFRQVMDRVEVDQIQSYCHYCLNDTALAGPAAVLGGKGVGGLQFRAAGDAPAQQRRPAGLASRARGRARPKCAEAAALLPRTRRRPRQARACSFPSPTSRSLRTLSARPIPKRILQNIREVEEPIDEELLADVQSVLAPIHNVTWPSGRPENN